MFIIGINGSPNRKGNTVTLLEASLKAAEELGAETALYHGVDALKGVKNPFCVVCSTPCSGACYQGTSLDELFKVMRKADGIILGSPVYFGTVSAQMKCIWDKTRKLRAEKVFLNMVGGALAVGNSRFGGQETTVRALQDIMLVEGMTVVGDGYEEADCGHQGACAQRPAEQDTIGMERARILGRRIAQVAKVTQELRHCRTVE